MEVGVGLQQKDERFIWGDSCDVVEGLSILGAVEAVGLDYGLGLLFCFFGDGMHDCNQRQDYKDNVCNFGHLNLNNNDNNCCMHESQHFLSLCDLLDKIIFQQGG